jgi:hypothetical protein
MTDHPNARRLDGLAAGGHDHDLEAEAHLGRCAACAAYVGGLRAELPAVPASEAEAFVAAVIARGAAATPPPTAAPGAAATPPRAARSRGALVPFGGRARRLAFAGGPLLAAAAVAFVLWRPAPAPAPGDDRRAAAPDAPVRFKGELALAVVRDRAGEQERFVHEATVRAGDRIRLEVSGPGEGPLLAGVLGDDGAWLPLLELAAAGPGTHLSDRSARFDAEPTEGFVLAGRPDDVERARATRRFDGVAALRLRYERHP